MKSGERRERKQKVKKTQNVIDTSKEEEGKPMRIHSRLIVERVKSWSMIFAAYVFNLSTKWRDDIASWKEVLGKSWKRLS